MSPAAHRLVARSRAISPVEPVPSPCISVCRMTPNGRCEGCYRTLDEIAAWSRMDDAGKRDVWRAIAQRATA